MTMTNKYFCSKLSKVRNVIFLAIHWQMFWVYMTDFVAPDFQCYEYLYMGNEDKLLAKDKTSLVKSFYYI